MSRTYKDELSKKTSRIVLEVLQNRDGTYEAFWKGERVRSRVPERWLSAELCVYGFCGDEYKAIFSHLSESGKATVVLYTASAMNVCSAARKRTPDADTASQSRLFEL